MKKIFINAILIVFVGITVSTNAQWFWQNPLPQGNSLRDVYVFDDNTVIAIGDAGTIIRTIDGGLNWSIKSLDINLSAIHFINQFTGWAIGYDSDYTNRMILNTNDGGLNWVKEYTTSQMWLSDIFFIDALTGWVVIPGGWLSNNKILKTSDGGTNWVNHETNVYWPGTEVFFVNNRYWMDGKLVSVLRHSNL